jgi:hypothetical protein
MTPALFLLALQGPAAPSAAAPPPVADPPAASSPAADPQAPAGPPPAVSPPSVAPTSPADPPTTASSPPAPPSDPPTAAVATPSADPPLTPGERAFLRRAARRELLLDPQEVLQNQWPTAPFCNLDPKGKDACLTLDGELFTGYRRSSLAGNRKFSEFALDRAELGTQFWWRPHWRFDTGVALRVEAIRSAGPKSIIGIDGNSLIMRLAQAYGHGAIHLGPIDIGVRFGQIPERWIEQLEKGYDTRGADPLASDRIALFDRADLGGSLTISGWKGRFDVDVALTNGEGRAQLELNTGKNTTVIATVRPLRFRHARAARSPSPFTACTATAPSASGCRLRSSATTAPAPRSPSRARGPSAASSTSAASATRRGPTASPTPSARGPARTPISRGSACWRSTIIPARTSPSPAARSTSSPPRCSRDVFGYVYRNRRRVRLHAGYQYEGYGPAAGPVPGAPEAANTHRFMLQLTAQGLFRVL